MEKVFQGEKIEKLRVREGVIVKRAQHEVGNVLGSYSTFTAIPTILIRLIPFQ